MAQQRRVDDPDDQEDLNRELWEFARHTSYDSILPYVAAAQKRSKAGAVAEAELPNGWRIAPAGTQVEVGRLPYAAVMFAGKLVVLDTGYYHPKDKEPQEVSIVDMATARVVKTLRITSLFPSAVVAGDGNLYISGGYDQKIYRVNRQFEIDHEYPLDGFAGGLAAIDAQHLAVATMALKNAKGEYLNGRLSILNTSNGKTDREVDLGYFPYAVRFVAGKLFVTLLGEDKLLVFDGGLKLLKTIPVGRTPQEMCSDGRTLFVVNTSSDDVSRIDARTLRINSSISVATKGSRFGTTPSACEVNSQNIYVTLAGINAVAVIDRNTRKHTALIPTGWYPTNVLFEKNQLIITSAKGIRPRRPNPEGPQPNQASRVPGYVLNLLKGSISIIPRDDLKRNAVKWTAQVNSASPLFDMKRGLRLPIKHIFYIIKENRTYDQVLGDLGRGNGDPKLTLFGEDISPVHHQLARDFVTLDNFFVNGEISVLGHAFTTSGYASPFTEWLGNVSYSYRWKGYPFGTVPATMSPVYIWDLLDGGGIDYRIYGENYFLFTRAYRIFSEMYGPDSEIARRFYDKTIAAAAGEDRGQEFNDLTRPYYGRVNSSTDAYKLLGEHNFASALSQFLTGDETFARMMQRDDKLRRRFGDYLSKYPFSYRSWDLKVSDLDRVREWKKDFDAQLKSGRVAQFQYIWLPNDHTDGNRDTILDPFQFMAQNDAALGKIVEIISHSPVWKDSLILVVEDDAQNGPDHVDATRSIALVAGPYVKRGAVVSDRYDQLSMLRTIELLLGLKSMNAAEQLAAPMFGIFAEQPDFRPFTVNRVSDRLASDDKQRYRELQSR
ncbi:MAG TPA: bifunctional YncE family protein/alkaline phosphatase family protein [Pyrinomonadaceae bacterium]|nr:bifunctional YncE family protein/alkaline phosphatase family protein [Pyrinomonadaceae bacterium]